MKEKILITVKTYPTLSRTYAELVCTAGVNEAGEWRRLYPVQFRQLHEEQQYRKFQWVEADISKSTRDARPESYKVLQETLKVVDEPLFRKAKVKRDRRISFATTIQSYDDMALLTSLAHNNQVSLALFQPTEIIDFSGKYNIMLILGTTEDAHRRKLPEQFIIIGVVPLPLNLQSAFSL